MCKFEWERSSHMLKHQPDGFSAAVEAIITAIIDNGIPYKSIPNVFKMAQMIIDEETRPVRKEFTSDQAPP